MSDTTKTQKVDLQLQELELNRETIQDLTEQQGEQARGGALRNTGKGNNVCTWPESGCII